MAWADVSRLKSGEYGLRMDIRNHRDLDRTGSAVGQIIAHGLHLALPVLLLRVATNF